VEKSRPWIEARLERQGEPVPFVPGAVVPLRGVPHELRHAGGLRGTVHLDSTRQIVLVHGAVEHFARRVADWLKGEARHDLLRASERYAAAMGVAFRQITIRDQSSRWGSCSPAGALSYSWRLILAPPWALDYVAAHEVAHLRHMNHGVRFWRTVIAHCPETRAAREWFRREGANLHRYGP
jgi:predicted metal-dependent hydrolase